MPNDNDILSAFDLVEDTKQDEVLLSSHDPEQHSVTTEECSELMTILEPKIIVPVPIVEQKDILASTPINTQKTFARISKDSFIFLIKYFSTSVCIF